MLSQGRYRFALHTRFPHWAQNMLERHRTPSQGNIYLRHREADDMAIGTTKALFRVGGAPAYECTYRGLGTAPTSRAQPRRGMRGRRSCRRLLQPQPVPPSSLPASRGEDSSGCGPIVPVEAAWQDGASTARTQFLLRVCWAITMHNIHHKMQ